MEPYKKTPETAMVEDPTIKLTREINLETRQNRRLKVKVKAAPLKKQQAGGGGGRGRGGGLGRGDGLEPACPRAPGSSESDRWPGSVV